MQHVHVVLLEDIWTTKGCIEACRFQSFLSGMAHLFYHALHICDGQPDNLYLLHFSDYRDFLEDLEEDPQYRENINIYKGKYF